MVFQIGILQEPSIDFWARELTIDEHLEPNDFLTKIFKIPKQQLIWHIFSMSAIRKNCACFLLLQTFVTKISQQPNWKPNTSNYLTIVNICLSTFWFCESTWNQLIYSFAFWSWCHNFFSCKLLITSSTIWFHYQIHTKHVIINTVNSPRLLMNDESDRKYF